MQSQRSMVQLSRFPVLAMSSQALFFHPTSTTLRPSRVFASSASRPPSDKVLALWRRADAVCFDVDSTVVTEEGIDVLADVSVLCGPVMWAVLCGPVTSAVLCGPVMSAVLCKWAVLCVDCDVGCVLWTCDVGCDAWTVMSAVLCGPVTSAVFCGPVKSAVLCGPVAWAVFCGVGCVLWRGLCSVDL
eukprot:g63897.t1